MIVTALWLGACAPPVPDTAGCDPTCSCDPAGVAIGTGPLPFVPIEAGQDVVMVHGPQGGWHVLAGLRAEGVPPIVRIHYTIDALVAEPPVRVSDTRYRVMLVSDGDCGGDYPDLFGYLDVRGLADGERDTPPEILAGTTLRMTMTVDDDAGRTAESAVEVRAVPDPIDAMLR